MKDIVAELKKIKNLTPHKLLDLEALEQLKKSELPLLLWGSGNYAEYIFQILKRNDIVVDGVFIDQKSERLTFQEYEVLSFEDIKNKYAKINIIRGNGNIERETYYREMDNVNSVYSFFDLMGFGWYLNETTFDNYSKTINDMYNELVDYVSKESFKAYLKSRYLNDWIYIQPHVCSKMYFPDFIQISNEESFVDCGAFDGDTFRLFEKKTKVWKNYIAFEPSIKPLDEINKYIETHKLQNIKTFKMGVWNKKTCLSFIEENDISRIVEGKIDNATKIEVDTIDNVCNKIPVTYIKMDLEGSELVALEGAINTIIKNKPKLAISIYHKPSDLINIYQHIKHLNLGYKFYFRIHTAVGSDAVLYAI
jgi:FkbM family methyltransferase